MIETYTQISQNLKNGKFSKIYLLMGEETFFTDKISNFFQNEFIDESLKEFNRNSLWKRFFNIKSSKFM